MLEILACPWDSGTRINRFSQYKKRQQQCPSNPPISQDNNCSVSGPDTCSTDHPGLGRGPGLHCSSDDWLTPQCRCRQCSTGINNTVPVRNHQDGRDNSSSLSPKPCRPYQCVSFTSRTGWAPPTTRVFSTQQGCHCSTEFNSKDSSTNGPSYHDSQTIPESVCDGMGSALLVNPSELFSLSHHGLHGDGPGFVGGGRDRARGRVRSEVPGSCSAPEIVHSNIYFPGAGVPVTS